MMEKILAVTIGVILANLALPWIRVILLGCWSAVRGHAGGGSARESVAPAEPEP